MAGRRFLVTGGTRGIGRGIVLAAARAGADVVTCYRSPGESVNSLERELAETPGKHRVLQADAADERDVARLLAECEASLGGVDVVVNNAGAFQPKLYPELGSADWAATVQGNLTAAHLVTQRALPLFDGGGSIINLGSTVARIGMVGGVHYTAVKQALVGMTRSLARELGPQGIRVNTVSPGRIATEALDELPAEAAEQQRRLFSSFAALGRLGTVEEVAQVVLFLAGDQAAYITGQNIHVDGCV
ncbi:SDR family NAD(P)-dependent oxidoreductase [Kitasatospora sp. MAP12-44]|uniref:SDR family NAD(P)-dependent oxidoreductase n=1 Tax=Kitasatospora sp. MAP12-44 TaxID=3035099 RepID=UPI0024733340|nr:SDR family NAD(P)-dependent oxidoreductase [Kitasatospora sp. MAP12-44]